MAEGAEHLCGEQDDSKQDAQLPEEQPVGLAAQGFVGAQQGEILAEGRDLGKASK